MRRLFAAICLLGFAFPALAEDLIPPRHPALSRNIDFYGSDLQNIFDTTLDACQNACLANRDCTAFTFNTRSNACFPKRGISDVTPYEGAMSVRMIPAEDGALALAATRAPDLGFVYPQDMSAAYDLALRIGRYYAADERAASELLDTAESRSQSGDPVAAYAFLGAALSLEDSAALWTRFSTEALALPTSYSNRSTAIQRAVPAAINGYLRAASDTDRTEALIALAHAFEANGRGKFMIPTLRLAQAISPRRDTESLLEDAIGKYGFRVADTRVESDSATPRICATFNEPLARQGVDYAPYVQLPEPGLTVTATGSDLCIDGVRHGERYRIVMREGLPAASGEKTARAAELVLYVRDRSPAARFLSNAYVLPRLGEVAMPIETVNLSEIDVTLRRISDRNILRSMQDGLFGNPLYEYNLDGLDQNMAEQVWSGKVAVANDLNADTLSRIPLTDALAGQPAGLYLISAAIPGADPYDKPAATQWFALSDLGVATLLGNDGLTVAVRSLGTAQTVQGAAVTLLSESNRILGTTTTDAEGVARFAAGLTRGLGSARPALVTVTDDQDIAFLSLTNAAFDLSDRGVEGRDPSGPIDVFLTPDRGAYHAGETIHLTALMRDGSAKALDNLPLTAILYRPDGVEYSRITSTAAVSGGHVIDLPVATTVPRGAWRIEVKSDVQAPALATTSVLIEDFLPERIDFDLGLPDRLVAGDVPDLTVTAKYLFGPPASDLAVEGEVRLRAVAAVAGWEGFQFGRYDDPFSPRAASFGGITTDAEGIAVTPIDLTTDGPVNRPLEARVTVRVAEGSGRPVERRKTVPVLPGNTMIGIKPSFDGVAPEGGEAGFSLIALDADLRPTELGATWTVNRLHTKYQWYSLYGSWRWEPVTTRERIATGSVTLGQTALQIAAPVEWGSYELVVEQSGVENPVTSSTRFYAGWYVSAETPNTPDLLESSLDAERYAVGDTATLRIVPRYAGTAVVTVLSDHVIHMQSVPVTTGENLVTLPVTEDWGTGAYVTTSVIRPMDVAAGRNPARALGVGYAAIDPGERALAVSVSVPDGPVRPRGRMEVAVDVEGGKAGEPIYVTLAAVDVGILNLTAFAAPDPADHYFGQRRLGVELRDVYGNLIDGLNGAMGTIRSGGDAMAQMTAQSPPPTEQLVAFFSGPVQVGADGRALIGFDLPAFNGTIRLMAVAWSATGVGNAATDVIVRDPIVLTASVPRFMAPGDQSRALLEITHTDGPAGDVGMTVTADGLALAGQVLPSTFALAEGGKQTFSLPFAAFDAGVHSLTITLTTPDGQSFDKVLTVPVVVNDPPVSRQSRFTLAAGDTFTFDPNAFAGLASGTAQATLTVGPLARFDAAGLLAALDRYPYGCTEQITSAAMPLIYFNEVAQAMDLGTTDQLSLRVDQAIREVLGNQSSNGAFGLWRPDSGDMWLDAYVTDFLSRARQAGFMVPDLAYRNAVDNLRNRVNYYPDFDKGGQDLAYALLVLAREGVASVGDLRYYSDEKADAFASPLALAQLGAALANYGDPTRADAMFRRAGTELAKTLTTKENLLWRMDFGTNQRDAAAVLALATEAGSNAIDREGIARVVANRGAQVSTQEAVWTLLAANAMLQDIRDTGVTIDGQIPTGPLVRVADDQTDMAPVVVRNDGTNPTEITVTAFGVPTEPEPAGGNGYGIERAYFLMDGTPTEPSGHPVGTRMVVVLTVKSFGRQEARLMVNDPLPAGFEIDNPNLLQSGEISALEWLDPVQTQSAQFRADRFLGAVDWFGEGQFRLAYIARTVSPGAFHHPAAVVEDMYRPQMRARTATGQVLVTD